MKILLTFVFCCLPLFSFADFLVADNKNVNDSLVSLKENGYIVSDVKREDGVFIIQYHSPLPSLPPPGAALNAWLGNN